MLNLLMYWEPVATLFWCCLVIWFARAILRARRHKEGGESLWDDAWKRLSKNKMAIASFVFISILVLTCLIVPWLLNFYGINYYDGKRELALLKGPSLANWFGTDKHGRDLLVRVLVGLRLSLAVAIVAGAVATIVGTAYGIISGYRGGKTDDIMMRVLEVIYSLPFTLIVIVLGAVLTARFQNLLDEKMSNATTSGEALQLQVAIGNLPMIFILFIAIGLIAWPSLARVIRGEVLIIKQNEFVLAARAMGASSVHIMIRHIFPNVLGFVAVYATMEMPSIMLYEAFLSFLGLGIPPPFPSLGTLISDGADLFRLYWWLLVFPGSAMCLMLLAFNFLGDGLRDAFDPKQKEKSS